jgi:hypothetical protein
MSRVLGLYLLRRALLGAALTLAALSWVYLACLIGDQGRRAAVTLGWSAALRLMAWHLPLVAVQLAPAAVLLGSVLALSASRQRLELAALAAVGASRLQLAAPLLVTGALATALSLAVAEGLVPRCEQEADRGAGPVASTLTGVTPPRTRWLTLARRLGVGGAGRDARRRHRADAGADRLAGERELRARWAAAARRPVEPDGARRRHAGAALGRGASARTACCESGRRRSRLASAAAPTPGPGSGRSRPDPGEPGAAHAAGLSVAVRGAGGSRCRAGHGARRAGRGVAAGAGAGLARGRAWLAVAGGWLLGRTLVIGPVAAAWGPVLGIGLAGLAAAAWDGRALGWVFRRLQGAA